MTEVLELAKFVQDDGMTQMNVGSRGVKTLFNSQRFTGGFRTSQFLFELFFNEKRVCAALNQRHRFFNIFRYRKLFFLSSICHLLKHPEILGGTPRRLEKINVL